MDTLRDGVPIGGDKVIAWGSSSEAIERHPLGVVEALHVAWAEVELFGQQTTVRLLRSKVRSTPIHRFSATVCLDQEPTLADYERVRSAMEKVLGEGEEVGGAERQCNWIRETLEIKLSVYSPREFEDGSERLVIWVKRIGVPRG